MKTTKANAAHLFRCYQQGSMTAEQFERSAGVTVAAYTGETPRKQAERRARELGASIEWDDSDRLRTCGRCHVKHCTPGGVTAPGHGYGSVGGAP